jgi:hypothetical protein
VATPLWVRTLVCVALVGGPGWWALQWHDRTVNERRLAAIASQIAGRPVHVRCPGVVGRLLGWDTVEGSVAFDAAGRPADVTKLRTFACAELDALAEGRRAAVLACVARGTRCGSAEDDVAMAVDVLTHESFHLSGIADEAQTECRSLQTMGWTAERLGVTPAVAQRLAVHQATHGYLLMASRYRGACVLPGQAAPSAGR